MATITAKNGIDVDQLMETIRRSGMIPNWVRSPSSPGVRGRTAPTMWGRSPGFTHAVGNPTFCWLAFYK